MIARRSRLKHVSLALGTLVLAAAPHATAGQAGPARDSGAGSLHACAQNAQGKLRLIDPPATCKASEVAVEWSIQGPMGPGGPAGPTGAQGPPGPPADLSITLSCSGDVARVRTCTGPGSCVDQRYPCAPYGCDESGTTCQGACASDDDCSSGARCNQGDSACTVLTYHCSDAFTVTSSVGLAERCDPYTCKAGHCQQQCSSNGDCATGYFCFSDGRCKSLVPSP